LVFGTPRRSGFKGLTEISTVFDFRGCPVSRVTRILDERIRSVKWLPQEGEPLFLTRYSMDFLVYSKGNRYFGGMRCLEMTDPPPDGQTDGQTARQSDYHRAPTSSDVGPIVITKIPIEFLCHDSVL
jgi:hypothetical protein